MPCKNSWGNARAAPRFRSCKLRTPQGTGTWGLFFAGRLAPFFCFDKPAVISGSQRKCAQNQVIFPGKSSGLQGKGHGEATGDGCFFLILYSSYNLYIDNIHFKSIEFCCFSLDHPTSNIIKSPEPRSKSINHHEHAVMKVADAHMANPLGHHLQVVRVARVRDAPRDWSAPGRSTVLGG